MRTAANAGGHCHNIWQENSTPGVRKQRAIAITDRIRGAWYKSNAGISPQNGEDYEPIEDSYPE